MEDYTRNNRIGIVYYLLLFFFLSACFGEKEIPKNEQKENVPAVLSNSNQKSSKTDSIKEEKKTPNTKTQVAENQPKTLILSPHQKLLASLEKNLNIEYSPNDYEILKNDTAFRINQKQYQISYATACLNDSLVAQEMLDYALQQKKSYLISHNYQTNISIKVNGITTGAKLIKKEIFKGKIDQNFLEKSIIKHPNFVKFDAEKNEAVFEFMIGVPNTDWLVIAGVNLNSQGGVRIIDIMMPEM
jgi:hypothetical protein